MIKYLVTAAILSVSCQLCNCDVESAFVRLYDPTGTTLVTGELTFTHTANGVRITGEVRGIHEGKHGGHVHESGNITWGCSGSGGVFNPYNKPHASPEDKVRTVGDLGNVVADRYGVTHIDMTDAWIKLHSGFDGIIGRAFVIHEKEDDLGKGGGNSKVDGNCGGLIACGVIEVLKE